MSFIRKIYKRDYRAFESLPIRTTTVTEKYSNASQRVLLKQYLMTDFHKKCIYCGWSCQRYGGEVFHIEHVKSKENFPTLIDDYSNLALSCPICNTTKKEKELPGDLDPISVDFQKLFYRNNRGAIVSNNSLTVSKKVISEECLQILGLHKELHKLDYVYEALDLIKRDIREKKGDDRLVLTIQEIIDFINDNYSRNSRTAF